MRYQSQERDYYRPAKRLLKDKHNGKIAGVCAGIANYYNVPSIFIRVIAVLAGFTLPTFVVLGYLIAALVLPNR